VLAGLLSDPWYKGFYIYASPYSVGLVMFGNDGFTYTLEMLTE
jgi:hypothetical protein